MLVVEGSHCTVPAVAACNSSSSAAAMLPRYGLQGQVNHVICHFLACWSPLIAAVLAMVGPAQSVVGSDTNVRDGLNFEEFGGQTFRPMDTHQGPASEISGQDAPEAFCPSSSPASEELCIWFAALPPCRAQPRHPFRFPVSNHDSFLCSSALTYVAAAMDP